MENSATTPSFLCLNCGKELDARKYTYTNYCDSRCYERARTETNRNSRPFAALDGEGIGSKYILLAGSNAEPLFNRAGIGTESALLYLLDLPRGSRSHGERPIYVWFAMDYDVNMMLQDIPLKGKKGSIEDLRANGHTWWHGFRIQYTARKIFRVSKDGHKHSSYDVWGFFQGTFEKATREWKVEIDKVITEGKAARSDFSDWEDADIIRYNAAELKSLCEITEKLREATSPLELPIQGWYGPGALASSWLQKQKIKNYQNDENEEKFREISARAFFGGRIDAVGYGFLQPAYHYDIISAYPYAITKLPDLSRAEWQISTAIKNSSVYCALVTWDVGAATWGPFPWRNKAGSIRYPRQGIGWYWHPEIESAIKKFGAKAIHIHKVLRCTNSAELDYPLASPIQEMFDYRRELKAKGEMSNKAIKLILNSLYGKFAQTVGRAKYQSLIWAGLITSHTRARLLDSITDDTVCVMTDSIWSKTPLDVTGDKLGDWEQLDDKTLGLVMAGLYTSESPTKGKTIWQRGFDRNHPVDIAGIIDQWLGDDPAFIANYKIHRFIGMGLASMTHYPWCNWLELDRQIRPVPLVGTTKRLPYFPIRDGRIQSSDFIELTPRAADDENISYPYKRAELSEALVIRNLEDECYCG